MFRISSFTLTASVCKDTKYPLSAATGRPTQGYGVSEDGGFAPLSAATGRRRVASDVRCFASLIKSPPTGESAKGPEETTDFTDYADYADLILAGIQNIYIPLSTISPCSSLAWSGP